MNSITGTYPGSTGFTESCRRAETPCTIIRTGISTECIWRPWGAAAVAAEATTMVPAAGIAGWFGATVAAPTALAMAATAALPITVLAAGLAGGSYVYTKHTWRNATTFPDPRKHVVAKAGKPFSSREKGEFLSTVWGSSGGSLASSGPSGGMFLGSYSGCYAGAVSAAFSPGAAAIWAPSAASASILSAYDN